MRASDMTHGTSPDSRIVAQPPFGQPPFDPKEPLPVSRTRVRVGLLLLITTFGVGILSSFFPAARVWLFAGCVLLIIYTSWILGLHRLRARGRHPRKLYGLSQGLNNSTRARDRQIRRGCNIWPKDVTFEGRM
ncbi:MAG: hypothetical protein ACREFF_08850 [Candidatus Udaeobacter sp.]